MQNERTFLKLENIVKTFPGVRALDQVHLEVKKGEVHALCGENGAGKSTLMKIISGAQPYTSGVMYIDDKQVKFHSTKDAEKQGIVMIYQEFNLVPELTVAENMFLGRLPVKRIKIVNWKELKIEAQKVLDRLGLRINSGIKVKNLSVAQTQMIEIAKALTIGARLIIMDEPTAALTEEEIKVLFSIIEDLKKEGIAILYISHRMDEIFTIADRITVFRDGKYISTQNTKDTSYDEIVSIMVGKSVKDLYPKRHYENQEIVLELKEIKGKNVNKVNLQLHKGEILGIVGLLGAGNIELSKIIYGALPMKSGEIYIKEKLIDSRTPIKAMKEGIGFVSDDRKKEGLVLIRNVKENISLSSLKKIEKGFLLDCKKEVELVKRNIEKFEIKVSSLKQQVENLSGGNQQKVVFAKVIEKNPDICILDEPTRGVDVGAKAEIYHIIDELTQNGKSIILVSSDLPEVIGMSDRVVVMREGSVVKEILKQDLTQELVLAHASGGIKE